MMTKFITISLITQINVSLSVISTMRVIYNKKELIMYNNDPIVCLPYDKQEATIWDDTSLQPSHWSALNIK